MEVVGTRRTMTNRHLGLVRHGDNGSRHGKAPMCGEDYQGRISGPLFDRIDIHVDVPPVDPLDMSAPPPKEDSAAVAKRVAAARALRRHH